ncbi:hypothetical protein NDR87_31575 [Nocardia sp. CDC159]|uniref:Uncharacterized protein n=1 Tax=Nocardia pulmonis TaxID=2951408 RepID=A0A9X2J0K2_9NOCA|nr:MULTISPECIES: hypothetical protein [Nocardia]MCM6777909.1 hypothetical protein [Nocardia pulmonis]MCM6790920.1 hypothetical protein [Nocardia sp. CDC159]
MTCTRYPYSAHVTFPDGTSDDYDRWSNEATHAVVGRDRDGLTKSERLIVAEWCTDPEAARTCAEQWLARYGGEWTVVPVTYTTPGNLH